MGLSGQQRKKLQEALIDAFPDKASLEQMLDFELDKKLDEIAEGNNLKVIVFNLIKTAKSQGWIEDLVIAAFNENPENLKLKAIAQELSIATPKVINKKFLKLGQEYNTRNNLLNTISKKVDDLLYYHLPDSKQINILKQSRPELIWRPRIEDFNPSRKSNPFPPLETNIIEVFLENAGRLLILGEPGSGKTITLLGLAKYLVNEAKNDSNKPVPVVFHLSSWDNQNMEEWLVEQLVEDYTLSPKKALNLLKKRQLLPLLDDLDRLDISRHNKCVKAINDFLSNEKFEPDNLVVCSCRDEYDKRLFRLKLNGAIYLHPLTKAQIHNYLVYIGRSELWTNIQEQPSILQLIKKPLFLFMMLQITEKKSTIEVWTRFYNDKEESIRFLFDNYIEERLDEHKSQISRKRQKLWFKNLAIHFNKIKNKSNSDLLIEKIQPNDWLRNDNTKRIYFSLVAFLIGIVTSPIVLLIYTYSINTKDVRVVYKLIIIMIISMMIGFLISLLNLEIHPVETLKIPWKEIVNALRYVGLKERLLNSFILNIREFTQLDNLKWIINSLIRGIFGALVPFTATIRESFRGIRGFDIKVEERKVINQGIKNSAKNGLLCALIYGLLSFLLGLVYALINNADIWIIGIICGLIGMLFGGLFGGLLACIQHFTLRLIIVCCGDMPWRYDRFLKYATTQRFLQREGGRYRFIDPLLQKHFTTIDTH